LNGIANKDAFDRVERRQVPCGAKILSTKWVFDLKKNKFGLVVRYKARHTIRGFEARAGFEYTDIFASVLRMSSLRLVLSLAAGLGLRVHMVDIVQAFLCAHLKETIYVEPPEGAGEEPDTVWLLNKALYGLKQAPVAWEQEFASVLVHKLKFRRLDGDHGLYVRGSGANLVILAVYVDDVVIAYAGSEAAMKAGFMAELQRAFDIKDIGPISF
jgi:hypothetical protein